MSVGGDSFFLIGAGFSRAFSGDMPLLSELGRSVLEEMNSPENTLAPFGDNLEQWLSYLSVDQPWLSDAENLRNRATFREASTAVKISIERAESRVLRDPIPPWAMRLVWDWCATGSHVATFNYDLLVERVASELLLTRTWADLYGMPLMERLAPGDHYMFATQPPPGRVLTLYKLHGSTNWGYGGPDAPTTDRVVMTENHKWWRSAAVSRRNDQATGREAPLYDDLMPLVVPPTGTKGPFYGNSSLRAQWRRAFASLSRGESLTIIGYSFPPSDLVARHFLTTAGPECPITVVDASGRVADEVQRLLPGACVSCYSGTNAVRDFVEATCGDLIEWSVVREDDIWRAKLTVNGAVSFLTSGDGSTDAFGDEAHPRGLLEQEIDRRWPGVRARMPGNIQPPADEWGNRRDMAYAGHRSP